MTWTAPTRDPVDGPLIGADRPILEGFLAWQRATLFIICAGPGGEQLAARPLASSNLSLLVLVRHLAEVERIWFRRAPPASPSSRCTTPSVARTPTSTASRPPTWKPTSDDCRVNGAGRTRPSRTWTPTTPRRRGLLVADGLPPHDLRILTSQRSRRSAGRKHRRGHRSRDPRQTLAFPISRASRRSHTPEPGVAPERYNRRE